MVHDLIELKEQAACLLQSVSKIHLQKDPIGLL
jgi:hypothetical protein